MLLLSYSVVANYFYRKITSPHHLLSSPAHIIQKGDVTEFSICYFSAWCFSFFVVFLPAVTVCTILCTWVFAHLEVCVRHQEKPRLVGAGAGSGSSTSSPACFPQCGTGLFCSYRRYLPTSHTVMQLYAHS